MGTRRSSPHEVGSVGSVDKVAGEWRPWRLRRIMHHLW